MSHVMRIARIERFDVALPLVEPFIISGGAVSERRSLIVALHDDEGHVGYGESPPFELPFYSAETLASAIDLTRRVLAPRVAGRAFESPEAVDEAVRSEIRGNPFARAGVETAAWDLAAHRAGVGMAQLVAGRLGVAAATSVPCGVALGIPGDRQPETLTRRVYDALQLGYRRVKIKIAPGWDEIAVRAARSGMAGTELPLTVDANGAYRWPDHERALRALGRPGGGRDQADHGNGRADGRSRSLGGPVAGRGTFPFRGPLATLEPLAASPSSRQQRHDSAREPAAHLLGNDTLQGSPGASQGRRADPGSASARRAAVQAGPRGDARAQARDRAGRVHGNDLEVGVDVRGRRTQARLPPSHGAERQRHVRIDGIRGEGAGAHRRAPQADPRGDPRRRDRERRALVLAAVSRPRCRGRVRRDRSPQTHAAGATRLASAFCPCAAFAAGATFRRPQAV